MNACTALRLRNIYPFKWAYVRSVLFLVDRASIQYYHYLKLWRENSD